MIDLVNKTPTTIYDGRLDEPKVDEIWARGGDKPQALARIIVKTLEKYQYVDVASIGAGTVNTTVKAIAIARERFHNIVVIPYFSTILDENGGEKTRIIMRVTLCQMPDRG